MLCNTISTLQLYGRGNLDEISAEFSGIEPYRRQFPANLKNSGTNSCEDLRGKLDE